MLDSLFGLFSGEGFPARWYCGTAWSEEPWWGWIHIFSDLAIFAAYFAIPLSLLQFIRRRVDLPFLGIAGLFALFIVACGITHLTEAIIFYWPVYRLSGLFKLITAGISIATVVHIQKVIPYALTMRSPEEAEQEVREKTAELRKVTEQLKQEVEKGNATNRQLREHREMLRLAMRAGDTGFYNWDLQTNEVAFDATEARITGIGTDGKIQAEDFLRRIPEAHVASVRAAIEDTIDGDTDYEAQFPFTRPDGEQIWLEGNGCVIREPDGTATNFIGLNRDISEQVNREQELDEQAREAEWRSEQKSRFVAHVSHEIRTPLTAMLGCIDALLAERQDEELVRSLRLLKTQGETLRILANDVLDLAKIERGKIDLQRQSTDLRGIIAATRSLMEPLAQERGITFQCNARSQVPKQIRLDPYRLKQVLINLVSNAVKFTERGSVVLNTYVEEDATSDGGEQLILVNEISDTGPGIPNAKIDALFEEYEQLMDKNAVGTGLGLSISKRLSELMGGSIEVDSEVGRGSTFTVRIPIEAASPERIPLEPLAIEGDEKPEKRVDAHFPLKVLVAEDTRAIQHVLRRLLEKRVDELVVVGNGKEAVEAVRQAAGAGKPFNVVLMDIQMPVMDGTAATMELRGAGIDIPIVALTAGAMKKEREACMAAGCTQFLPKPINIDDLLSTLSEVDHE
ncbi:MAG: hypothetical protein Aurels2KO_50730 [Aureliella sp.]